jgi:hypothetical protein
MEAAQSQRARFGYYNLIRSANAPMNDDSQQRGGKTPKLEPAKWPRWTLTLGTVLLLFSALGT